MKKKPTTVAEKKEQALLEELIAFYWRILDDKDLKPSDRIASAKRLEALLVSVDETKTAPVFVTLNLPEEVHTLGGEE